MVAQFRNSIITQKLSFVYISFLTKITYFFANSAQKFVHTKSTTEIGGIFTDTLALILSIIGSLNWGLIGIFQFDLVAWLFGGQGALLSRIVYALVGLAGVWCISLLFRRNAIATTDDM